MADDDEPHSRADEPAWDDVTDVVCVGSNAGVQAFAALCADQGLDVVMVALPPGALDDVSAAFIAAMTDGLAEPTPDGDEREPIRVKPAEFRRGRGERIDTFVGAELRPWATQCLGSPSGVLFTYVPDHALRPMRTGSGELITAAAVPRDVEPPADSGETLGALVLLAGRPAGAVLHGPRGERSVGTELGLAFAVGHGEREVSEGGALVSRRGSLFARRQTLACDD